MLKTMAVALVAAGLGGVAVASSGSAAVADSESPTSIVEDYAYPGAAEILASKGVKLSRGDGHILLTDCAAPGDLIKVESYDHADFVCFQLTGAHGFLTLEIGHAVFVRSEKKRIEATLILDGETEPEKPTEIKPDTWVPVGEAAELPAATLLELRA